MNIDQNQYGKYYAGGLDGSSREYGKNKAVRDTAAPGKTKEGKTAQGEETKSYREQLLEKMEEMAQNIKNGTIQPKFQTGAQAYTVKEWEKLLEKFDAAEETLRKEVEAQIEEAKEEAMRKAYAASVSDSEETTCVSENAAETADAGMDDPAALLTGEITKCSYPDGGSGQKHWYITCYGQEGISCKEAYFDGAGWVNKDLWSISYTEEGQCEKVLAFLQRFEQDANLRFASHKEFWEDFLAGAIDEEDFAAFFGTTKDGVPDYTYEKDGNVYIDREKAKYAKYMNAPGARLYSAEEMELILRAVLQENKRRFGQKPDESGAMAAPDGAGERKDAEEEELQTRIVTKPDGSRVLQITTSYGVMELEIAQAQKFGLLMK